MHMYKSIAKSVENTSIDLFLFDIVKYRIYN